MPRHWKSFVARCAIRGLMYGLLGGCFFNLAWIPPGPEYFDAMAVGGVACVTSIVLFLLLMVADPQFDGYRELHSLEERPSFHPDYGLPLSNRHAHGEWVISDHDPYELVRAGGQDG